MNDLHLECPVIHSGVEGAGIDLHSGHFANLCGPMESLKYLMIRLLRIRPDEEAITRTFMWHNFFQGLGLALVYSTAITSFLHYEDHEKIPLALALIYVAGAAVQLFAGRIYAYYEHHLDFGTLLRRAMILLVAAIVALAVAGYFIHHHIFWAGAIVCYRLFYMLSNLEFWGLSALAYDVRQGKRLFGLISAGDILARSFGYLLFKFVHDYVPESAFIVFAAMCYVLSMWFMNQCMKLSLRTARKHSHGHTHHTGAVKWFGSKLNFGIARLSFFSAFVYILLDFFFYSQAKSRHDDKELQNYILLVLLASEGATFLVKMAFSGRVYERWGNRISLLILPVFGAVMASVYFAAGYFFSGTPAEARLIAVLYAGFIAIRYSLNDPILLALFQPAGRAARLAGHTGMKTLADPTGMLLAGLLLLVPAYFSEHISILWFLPFIVIICLFWILSVSPVVKLFNTVLQEAIRKRFIHVADVLGKDQDTLSVFRTKLKSSHPGEVLLAIDALEDSGDPELKESCGVLLARTEITIVVRALELVRTHHWESALPQVEALTHSTQPEEVRRLAVKILLLRDASGTARERLLKDAPGDVVIRTEILLHSWNHGETPQRDDVRKDLRAMVVSGDPGREQAALNTIADAGIPGFTQDAFDIFRKNHPLTRDAALAVLAVAPDRSDLPLLITLLHQRSAAFAITPALSRAGDEILPDLKRIIHKIRKGNVAANAFRVLEGMHTEDSLRFLVESAHSGDNRLRFEAIRALAGRSDFSSGEKNNLSVSVLQSIGVNACYIAEWIAGNKSSALLTTAMEFELLLCREYLLSVLELKYGRETVRPVRAELARTHGEKKSNALEMLESHLTRPDSRLLNTLFDHVSAGERARRLRAFLPPNSDAAPGLDYILSAGEKIFSPWTIAVCMTEHPSSARSIPDFSAFLTCGNRLLEETAALVSDPLFIPSSLYAMEHSRNGHITTLEKVLVLKSTELFAETPENILATIAAILEEESVEEGEVLFRKGDLGSCMYIVYEGEVSIQDGSNELARQKSRGFFGELALLDSEPRSASAVAITDTKLLRLDQEEFYELMEQRQEVLKSMIRILCQRIRNLNTKLRSK